MRFTLALLLAISLPCQATESALASFEKVVATCRQTYAVPVPKVFFQPSIQKWVKRVEHPEDFKYDVRKTDSLVSPLTAYIEASTLGVAEFFETEDLANAANPPPSGKLSRSSVRYNYAHRGGAWAFVNAMETVTWRESANDSFREARSFTRTKESLTKEKLPWSACIQG